MIWTYRPTLPRSLSRCEYRLNEVNCSVKMKFPDRLLTRLFATYPRLCIHALHAKFGLLYVIHSYNYSPALCKDVINERMRPKPKQKTILQPNVHFTMIHDETFGHHFFSVLKMCNSSISLLVLICNFLLPVTFFFCTTSGNSCQSVTARALWGRDRIMLARTLAFPFRTIGLLCATTENDVLSHVAIKYSHT